MPIELNKILGDIAAENILKPTSTAKKDDIEQAWLRVSKKNSLSVHETKSIFKVLQKKFEQERQKEHSTWKLFDVMNEIHTAEEDDDEESDISMEENEEYEMLEVDEEQQQGTQENDKEEEEENAKTEQTAASKPATLNKSGTDMTSDGETPAKSKSDTSHENSPERAESKKNSLRCWLPATREEKKVLNLLLSPNSQRLSKSMTATTAVIALQKKGITLKKANTTAAAQKPQQASQPAQSQVASQSLLRNVQATESRTIQLPDSIKRKLNEDATTSPSTKKILLGQPSGNVKQISPKPLPQKTLIQSKFSGNGSLLMKKDSDDKISTNTNVREENTNSQGATTTMTENSTAVLNTSTVTVGNGLKVYTFPVENKTDANSALKVITLPSEGNTSLIANGISTTPMEKLTANGISATKIDELDFSDHILLNAASNASTATIKTEDIPNSCPENQDDGSLNLGNFCNELPRAFFNNLCNSKRYEAFALYIANAMNRLDTSTAARLEVTIMRALLDAQSEALQKS